MKAKFPPPPEDVLADLQRFLTGMIEQALQFGIDEAHKYFEEAQAAIDPWFFSHIVRFQAKRWLKANDVEDWGFEVLEPPLSGIWLQSRLYHLRIWKEDWGVDPVTQAEYARIQPGHSGARHRFFYQPELELEFPDGALLNDDDFVPQRVKLVVVWALNKNRELGIFELACPRSLDTELHDVTTHWWVPIPRGEDATSIDGVKAQEDPTERTTLEDIDLGIQSDHAQDDADQRG